MRKVGLTVACIIVAVLFVFNVEAAAHPVVNLIAPGGTIAMKIDPVKKAPVPAISGEDLLATVPDISKYAKVEVENLSNLPFYPIQKLNSKDLKWSKKRKSRNVSEGFFAHNISYYIMRNSQTHTR